MKNCPNCNAPIDPNTCKCGYCGTYYFDFSGLDLDGGKPCFIKMQNAIMKAYPCLRTIESRPNYDTCCDISGRLHTVKVSNDVSMEVTFNVLECKVESVDDGSKTIEFPKWEDDNGK